MRPSLVTLGPMLAAAGLVLVGGERLARQEVEERIPADRERLLDFADAFETELDRLDALYRSHLERIAKGFGESPVELLEEQARDIATIRAVHYFGYEKDREELSLAKVGENPRLPEVVLEDQPPPFNPNNAVVLPLDLMKWSRKGESGWRAAVQPAHRLYWTRPDMVRLVVFVIDRDALRNSIDNHLVEWISDPFTPLADAGEQVAVRGPTGTSLVSTAGVDRGPAALMMPFRNDLGDWRIQAWDRVTSTTAHDSATLTTVGAVAAILTLGGLFFYLQLRRALALAEERVSFVNRVSHELGTPLTNVALNLDLATEAMEVRPPEARRRLGIVTEEVERLARLVANVLTFSHRERRTLALAPQPCTPDEVIARTLESFRPALGRRAIEVDWKAAATKRVRLDPDALGQIVGNLISNVEKYATSGHWLGIESDLDHETLTVTISDRGPGIAAGKQDRIFKPFERVHRKVNEGASGTGLGLTIARELATRMGGSLELLTVGEGATFKLVLPAPAVLAVVPDDESSAA